MRYPGRNNGKSNQDMQEIANIMALLQSILKEVETFIHQIISDNYDEDVVANLSSRVSIKYNGTIVEVEIYNSANNTNIAYDMTIFNLLQFCSSKTLETLMNEKVIEMVDKLLVAKKSDDTQQLYLGHSF